MKPCVAAVACRALPAGHAICMHAAPSYKLLACPRAAPPPPAVRRALCQEREDRAGVRRRQQLVDAARRDHQLAVALIEREMAVASDSGRVSAAAAAAHARARVHTHTARARVRARARTHAHIGGVIAPIAARCDAHRSHGGRQMQLSATRTSTLPWRSSRRHRTARRRGGAAPAAPAEFAAGRIRHGARNICSDATMQTCIVATSGGTSCSPYSRQSVPLLSPIRTLILTNPCPYSHQPAPLPGASAVCTASACSHR